VDKQYYVDFKLTKEPAKELMKRAEGDEYNVNVAETRGEITELLKAGFEWVGQDTDSLTYFRKRKQPERCEFLQNVPRFRGFRIEVSL